MMKHLALILALGAFVIGPAGAADRVQPEDADMATKSAQIESLRARASLSPAATTSATLIEADDLLRQLRQAPPDKRLALRSQLETALIRLELEIDAAGRGKQ
ncbi:MAG: hypothetical protein FD176_2412 [Rhodospirillaceae bacterium]|nr:MAG: hypothetical protein FD176_2412 [Rhodospirillaceae bacterium]TNC98107.1 MAG: hypothetical protein FD119_590 [Stygiobacter sp.]